MSDVQGLFKDIDLSSGTPEIVALAMANLIRSREVIATNSQYPLEPVREYWLTLYAQCLAVVRGPNP